MGLNGQLAWMRDGFLEGARVRAYVRTGMGTQDPRGEKQEALLQIRECVKLLTHRVTDHAGR